MPTIPSHAQLFATSWNSPHQNIRVGSLSLLQGIFPTEGSNPGLLHCRWILHLLSHKRSPKKGNAKECSNYGTIALISRASKVMLKILQARLQQYMNWELPDVQAGFSKGRGTRDHIASIRWIIEKAREFQKKHLLLLYWLHQSPWLSGSQLNVENSERDWNTRPPDLPLEKFVYRSRSNS